MTDSVRIEDATAKPLPEPCFHSIPEVAEMFGVTTRTIRNWIRLGPLPAVRVRGRRYIPQAAIEAL
jgi:excisionase family DNA binding protein